MTDEELQAIRERARAATPGPWQAQRDVERIDGWAVTTAAPAWDDFRDLRIMLKRDARFVAHARADVPALLAEIDLLRSQVADLWDDGGGRAYALGRAAERQVLLDWLVRERDVCMRELETMPQNWGPGTRAGELRDRADALAEIHARLRRSLSDGGQATAAPPRPDALAEENRRLHGALKNLADACEALPGTASLSSVRSRTNHALAQARAVLAAPAREKAPG